ncbi:sulfurtransferase [Limnohabitans parvus II-B4]|uniref:Sulfurtransferase n=2 Tax=Limnohabitans TaxID=665874 RepID=A0A315FG52_9BURK|nr:sulfurtransferase [Limnohabitans parvus II-B4]
MKCIATWLLGLGFASVAFGQAAVIPVGTPLNIFDNQKTVVVKTTKGSVEITRVMTTAGKNGGSLQPLVPVPGVHPVGEIEILEALSDRNSLVVDMRDANDRVKGTIPGSVGIPYTEVASRLNELGCQKSGALWNCTAAKKVFAFCNGPVCPQSPMAIRAMTRDGFPADKIYYYRGGMLDWDALGLTMVKDEF